MSTVLITGASGLIGSPLTRALRERGWSVHTTSRGGPVSALHHPADLGDRAEAQRLVSTVRPTHVVHLAGGPAATPVEMLEKNVDTTSSLLLALARQPERLARLVSVGSAAEYGEGKSTPIAEHDPLDPVSPYGRAKAAQSHVVRLLGPALSDSVVVIRPFNVVAAGLPTSSPLGNLRRQVLVPEVAPRERRRISCGRLDVVRDFVPLSAVIDAITTMLELPSAPPTLNVASGRGLRLETLFTEVLRQAGVHGELVPEPALVALPAADRVVGDPTLLEQFGVRADVGLEALAACLLEGNS